jgi:hypothetical protein
VSIETTTAATLEKAYCNVLAMRRGLDPAGSAHDFDDALVVEIPLPWKKNIYQDAAVLSQEIIDLLGVWLQQYREGIPYRHRPLMVVPDPEYSRQGFRRVMFYTRPKAAFARFDKQEYLVPDDQFGALVWALYQSPDDLPRFERYRDPAAETARDLLVCTHGSVDAACAKFGYPLYKTLRQRHAADDLRVWRVSHFGGHVFAPTMMDMPTGHYWGYVEDPQAEQIAALRGPVETLRGNYRGWAGLEEGFLQAAEREMWQREGWRWLGYHKSGSILARDDAESPQWADVHIEFAAPDGSARGAYAARVELCAHVETEHTTNDLATYPYPQYRVTRLTAV